MKTTNIFKQKPLSEIQINDGSYIALVPNQTMSYFTPKGKARLKLEASYVLYRVDFDGETFPADIRRIKAFTRKSEALKAFRNWTKL